jgi:hypothetical protein
MCSAICVLRNDNHAMEGGLNRHQLNVLVKRLRRLDKCSSFLLKIAIDVRIESFEFPTPKAFFPSICSSNL